MKKYIAPHTTIISVEASCVICQSVTNVKSSSGPLQALGQVYIDIKNAL